MIPFEIKIQQFVLKSVEKESRFSISYTYNS